MSKKTDLIKKMIKTNVGQKPTYGTDPNDPWSAKAGITEDTINETALLNRYLKSRGINPEFVNKDQKVAHSKTNQFKTWMAAHINDPIKEGMSQEHTPTEKRLHTLKRAMHFQKEIRVANGHKKLHSEAVDKKDTITFDIPLLIRVLEFAREDLKSDINLHKMVERLLNIRGKGVLTMNQYGQIVKEEFDHLSEEQIDEISKELANRYMYSAKSDRAENDAKISKATEKQGKEWSSRRHKSIGKMLSKGEKRTQGIVRALDRITKEDVDESYGVRADKLLAHSHSLHQQSRKETDPVKKQQLSVMGSKAHKVFLKARDRNIAKDPEAHARKMQSGATQDYKDQEAKRGIGNVRDHVEVDGTVVEAKESNYGGDYQSSVLRVKELAKKKPVDIKSLADRMQASYRKDNQTKGVKKVGESLEPMAACNCPSDGANTPDDVAPKDKGKKLIQMSKTAKLVKSVVKGKNIKEEMYDHEKEDKSTAPLGKKVKLQKPDQDAITKEQPKAAAILTGGKTLTGEPRDTIEIDPMMKMRKQSGNTPKSV